MVYSIAQTEKNLAIKQRWKL